jgi:alkaline phosphatase D
MLTRRSFVVRSGLFVPTLLIGGRSHAMLGDYPFTLGVASGEPSSNGVVLWTRLAPRPLEPDGGMPAKSIAVRWDIYADEGLSRLVRSGETQARPEFGHAVHVEVAGLSSGRPFWYCFTCDGVASPVGLTRTAPAPIADVDSLRFCFASCQKYEAGFYSAWQHLVAERPDLVLFLGDYIYEGDPADSGVRRHLNPEPRDLAGYRVRYATYKLDPLLQAAHAAAPWVVTWDDHEVDNDYAGLLDEDNGSVEVFAKRRRAAYQAYWEHMPLRTAARAGGTMRLHRSLEWGRLARFQIVDDRQYRDFRPCQPPALLAEHRRYLNLIGDCPQRTDPHRSLLGEAQERWLLGELGRRPATWNVLAQQTLMMPYRKRDPDHPENPATFYSADTWGGYPATRERIIARWRAARVSNPMVVSGDIHSFVAGERYSEHGDGPSVAPEFVGGSITSLAHDPTLKTDTAAARGFRFAETEVRGYGRADLTAKGCQVTFRGIRDAKQAGSPAFDLAKFSVESGAPAIHRV